MKCPVCKSVEKSDGLDLHADGFAEDILTCNNCDTIWSVSHGVTNIVNAPQRKSFFSALSECVGADEFSFAV